MVPWGWHTLSDILLTPVVSNSNGEDKLVYLSLAAMTVGDKLGKVSVFLILGRWWGLDGEGWVCGRCFISFCFLGNSARFLPTRRIATESCSPAKSVVIQCIPRWLFLSFLLPLSWRWETTDDDWSKRRWSDVHTLKSFPNPWHRWAVAMNNGVGESSGCMGHTFVKSSKK